MIIYINKALRCCCFAAAAAATAITAADNDSCIV